MIYEISCDWCKERLEDCTCEPGFPDLIFCPVSVYDPKNHNVDTCPFCLEQKRLEQEFELELKKEHNQ